MHNSEESGPYRYVVAVIRSSDAENYKNISKLKGKRSCHGSINSLAGWNAPLTQLKKLGLIQGPTCGLTLQMSAFFGNRSCVPGTKDLSIYTKMPWLPTKNLCSLCAGDGPRKFCQLKFKLE